MQALLPFLLVGLGNPGTKYKDTRHNLGFLIAKECASKFGLQLQANRQCRGELATGYVGERQVYILCPTTYMNLSGEAVKKALDLVKTRYDHILIISDDVDTAFGMFRFREMGSSGGHNGLKSIEFSLSSRDYPRLRVGIGKPEGVDLADYVLENFAPDEMTLLPQIVSKGVEIVEKWMQSGPVEAAILARNAKIGM